MNREELMTLLPHRDGMLLLDEAEVRDGKALGKKKIHPEEFFLQGHFPGDPIVPGVLETECVIEKQKPPFYWAKGTGKVDGELSVSASFSFAVFPAEEKKG